MSRGARQHAARETNFWTFLHGLVQRLEDGPLDEADARDCLRQVDELFGRRFDPADAFEEYLVVRLCKAMMRARNASG